MYSFHNGNDLELELVDWKNNRMFRVLAVDHGTLSFADVKFGSWPIVLPTYPKNMEFMMPGKEKYEDYLRNTIRVLVFSDVLITRVTFAVDDDEPVEASQANDGPLYEMAWDASKHATGQHKLIVTAVDANDRSSVVEQMFTLNPSEAEQVDNFFSKLCTEILLHHLVPRVVHHDPTGERLHSIVYEVSLLPSTNWSTFPKIFAESEILCKVLPIQEIVSCLQLQ